MKRLTDETVDAIKELHSKWIALEIAGDAPGMMALCGEDIELRPPDQEAVVGRRAVLAKLTGGAARIHEVEISGMCLTGFNEAVTLEASFRTKFSLSEDAVPRDIAGRQRWELQKRGGRWLVVVVGWMIEGEN